MKMCFPRCLYMYIIDIFESVDNSIITMDYENITSTKQYSKNREVVKTF